MIAVKRTRKGGKIGLKYYFIVIVHDKRSGYNARSQEMGAAAGTSNCTSRHTTQQTR